MTSPRHAPSPSPIRATLLVSALLLPTLGCPTDDANEADDEAGTTSADVSTATTTDDTSTDDTSTDDTSTDDTTDTTTDTTTDDTTTGGPSPCEFEWTYREPLVWGVDQISSFTPIELDENDEPIVMHETGMAPAIDTLVMHVSSTGELGESLLDSLYPGQDYPQSLARMSDGDLLIGSTDYANSGAGAQLRRLGPAGELLWTSSYAHAAGLVGIEERPDGSIASLTTYVGANQGTTLILRTHNPESGGLTGLWQEAGSNAIGWALTDDPAGSLFVAASEVGGSGEIRPVVIAFAPGPLVAPQWTTPLPATPSEVVPHAIAWSPGRLFVVDQELDGAWMTRVSALDPVSGELLWTIDRDTLGLPEVESAQVGALAVGDDKLFMGGEWVLPGGAHQQAFFVELDLEGGLICSTTLDDYDPQLGYSQHAFFVNDAEIDGSGSVYASGRVTPTLGGPIEVLLAKVF